MEEWRNISPQDNFILTSDYFISNLERKALDILYQPIIGVNAYALINNLWRIYERDKDFEQHLNFELLAYLNIDVQTFYDSRLKLEGAGLIKTYVNDNHRYVYKLIKPLDINQFFNDDLLSVTLLQTIGEDRYEDIVNDVIIDKYNLENYNDISKNFLQVFRIKSSELSNTPQNVGKAKKLVANSTESGTNDIENSDDFDFSLVLSILEKSFVNISDVKKNHHLINSEHVLYGIDEPEMARFIEKATNVNNNVFDPNKLKLLVNRDFTTNNVSFGEDDRKTYLSDNNKLDKGEKQIVSMAKEIAPLDFLQGLKKQVDGFVHDNETRTIRDVMHVSVLKPEVINMVTYHIIIDQRKSGLSRNLFTTIADNWSQKGIRTAEDAVAEIRNRKKASDEKKREHKRKYRKPIKEELPDWAKDEHKNKAKDNTNSMPDESRKKELEDKLKRIRSWGKK
ncbi:replication initiation and membrane attachment family protein [Apilactobacillus quenuiae]|uniref:replication initiation and membrane attachment family protein n=1 Tax=Apilactobacillus quenuiae TaxID=2008377 RepID=UPI000D01B5F7|nr:DnaD domain protein [Apilactobacillus quenuiae]